MSILKRLGLARDDARPASPLVAAVRSELDALAPDRAELVAAFAGLLARVAYVDRVLSDDERAALRTALGAHAGLAPGEAEAVAAIVERQLASAAGIDYAALTRSFNERGTLAEKEQLLHCLFAVAGADDLVSLDEDEQVRAVASALLLSHAQFIAARQRFRDKLEVLRGLRRQRDPG